MVNGLHSLPIWTCGLVAVVLLYFCRTVQWVNWAQVGTHVELSHFPLVSTGVKRPLSPLSRPPGAVLWVHMWLDVRVTCVHLLAPDVLDGKSSVEMKASRAAANHLSPGWFDHIVTLILSRSSQRVLLYSSNRLDVVYIFLCVPTQYVCPGLLGHVQWILSTMFWIHVKMACYN